MDETTRRQINSVRMNWHMNLLRDAELRMHPTALVFAGLVLHRFHVEKGFAEISIESAMRATAMPRTSVIRARDYLTRRGWVQKREREKADNGSWKTARYTLAGGPDDLLIDQHDTASMTDIANRE